MFGFLGLGVIGGLDNPSLLVHILSIFALAGGLIIIASPYILILGSIAACGLALLSTRTKSRIGLGLLSILFVVIAIIVLNTPYL